MYSQLYGYRREKVGEGSDGTVSSLSLETPIFFEPCIMLFIHLLKLFWLRIVTYPTS
jgi:hypothetical protein